VPINDPGENMIATRRIEKPTLLPSLDSLRLEPPRAAEKKIPK
jgi:hypothetical protein